MELTIIEMVWLLHVRLRVLSVTKCLEFEVKIINVLVTSTGVELLLIEMLVCPIAKLTVMLIVLKWQ